MAESERARQLRQYAERLAELQEVPLTSMPSATR